MRVPYRSFSGRAMKGIDDVGEGGGGFSELSGRRGQGELHHTGVLDGVNDAGNEPGRVCRLAFDVEAEAFADSGCRSKCVTKSSCGITLGEDVGRLRIEGAI